MENIKAHTGSLALLGLPKTAFLCSRQVPAEVVLRCYDWAIEMRQAERCVISGFHSPLEKDVLHYLLKGKQPIIVALARGMKKQLDPAWLDGIAAGRLLIITPFEATVTRVSSATAHKRNDLMLSLTDNVTIGYARSGGDLAASLTHFPHLPKSFL